MRAINAQGRILTSALNAILDTTLNLEHTVFNVQTPVQRVLQLIIVKVAFITEKASSVSVLRVDMIILLLFISVERAN